ncbi:MAG: hypothetical protein J6Y78_01825 [Paludibacteraceae bacterium]|nr:hypothetical protein [Paludibacteraceae bacterium]
MIYYNNKSVKKLYNGTDLVTKMNKTVGDNVDRYETLQELIDTHTVVSIGSGKYNLEPSVSGLTFFRINLQYGTASKYIDLYREDETFDKYFGIRCDATGGLYKSIDGYSSIKSAADSTSCQWAYYVDTNIIEVDIVAAIGLTAHIGQINDGFNTSFISFLQHSSVAEDKAIFQYVTDGEEPTPVDYSKEYLTFVAEANNVSFSLAGGVNGNTFQYSTDDGQNWNNVSIGQSTSSINTGDKILFKATSLSVGNETGIGTIRPSGNASVEGNIMSLVYGDNFSGQTTISNNFQFRKLFSGATHITSAENMVLPATAFTKQCYSQMFQGCSSLTKAPKVVGTATATFSGDYCFSDMFANCSSMTTAPELPMTTLGTQCYWYMMQGCTSLTEAPLLPATTINTQSYNGMFMGCSNLNSVTCLATGGITTNNCNEWLKNVSETGTFTKAVNASWGRGQNAVPNNWTIVDYSE